MKTYDVAMEILFSKTIRVEAENRADAEEFATDIFMRSNQMPLSVRDLGYVEAEATSLDAEDDEEETLQTKAARMLRNMYQLAFRRKEHGDAELYRTAVEDLCPDCMEHVNCFCPLFPNAGPGKLCPCDRCCDDTDEDDDTEDDEDIDEDDEEEYINNLFVAIESALDNPKYPADQLSDLICELCDALEVILLSCRAK